MGSDAGSPDNALKELLASASGTPAVMGAPIERLLDYFVTRP